MVGKKERHEEFISCILMGELNDMPTDFVTGLCTTTISEPKEKKKKNHNVDIRSDLLPDTVELLEKSQIDKIVLSEGSMIYDKVQLNIDSLHLTDEGNDSSLRLYVWYELIRLLTGHQIFIDSLNEKIEYTRWVGRMSGNSDDDEDDGDDNNNNGATLCMELQSGNILKKIAEIKLNVVHTGEVDLFQMTQLLFNDYCKINDDKRLLNSKLKTLNERLRNFEEERVALDKILQERDNKTRSIVVGLLNSKKKKIRFLEQKLKDNGIIDEIDISDSEIINKNVTNVVSKLNAPGRKGKKKSSPLKTVKQKRATNSDNDDTLRKRQKINNNILPNGKDDKDDFVDFQFYGISSRNDKSRSSTPKTDNLKSEDNDDIKLEDVSTQDSISNVHTQESMPSDEFLDPEEKQATNDNGKDDDIMIKLEDSTDQKTSPPLEATERRKAKKGSSEDKSSSSTEDGDIKEPTDAKESGTDESSTEGETDTDT
ncbi:Lif1p NDAI_0I01250 [Naumovozyma dairenensis CBS 421]|uniref:Uncharacterized protein n=1 Tax=Naumovozyma dairenensis (strain ATCC 10597 / BCRC 20456 / CBS 421 / NBRC 0211 / NRRL Y-12639) TaxID=1071378 RepID=G0WFY3_NAUDC|nr:hypothetical protein NDAI_0I01250 [Naumovozyma dairenensis CBS 421]CCD26694.1 hypothetical protein NDAI_0I01250 [Naumovozyma dairenensis CBS 421]